MAKKKSTKKKVQTTRSELWEIIRRLTKLAWMYELSPRILADASLGGEFLRRMIDCSQMLDSEQRVDESLDLDIAEAHIIATKVYKGIREGLLSREEAEEQAEAVFKNT